MSAEHDRLRASLHDLADVAEHTDLYDRALGRSRRIARREAAVGTGAAVLVLAVLGSGLWGLPQSRPAEVSPAAAPAVAASRSAAAGASASSAAPAVPRASEPTEIPEQHPDPVRPAPDEQQPQPGRSRTAEPRSRAIADLTGHVFYAERKADPDVVRLSPAGGDSEVVLRDAPSSVGISPDGNRIAFVADGKLMISEAGGPAEQVAADVVATEQAPVWSPEGDRLLIAAEAPGVLDVETGTIVPLPADLAAGQHFRWSGDGSTLVYATSYCGLKLATGDTTTSTVPVLGATQPRDNPDGLAACKPTSVDVTGRRVTVPLQTTGETPTGSDTGDAIVDTATGQVEDPPVRGAVVGAVFDAAGDLLVRTDDDGRRMLSLFAPDGTLTVQAVEPASMRDLDLLAYTR